MEENMTTVLWFNVSSDLSNREISARLDPTVMPENDEEKDLVLFRRGNSEVACRTCPTVLKVFTETPEIVSAAHESFGQEIGES